MARKQPRLHCGGVVIAPLFKEKHRGAPAVRLDTDSNVSVCPMMHRHCPAGIFFKVLSRNVERVRLHFAVASCKLSDGLIVQLEDYLKDYPNSRLIVIDTLQKVRTASKDNAYASDYGDISLIKDFADRHSLAVIVVHHIRKQNDSDVFNKVSGTTGLTGSADATFVLENLVCFSLYLFSASSNNS